LAGALRWAYENYDVLEDIGIAGCDLYWKEFSSDVIARRLKPVLSQLANSGAESF